MTKRRRVRRHFGTIRLPDGTMHPVHDEKAAWFIDAQHQEILRLQAELARLEGRTKSGLILPPGVETAH